MWTKPSQRFLYVKQTEGHEMLYIITLNSSSDHSESGLKYFFFQLIVCVHLWSVFYTENILYCWINFSETDLNFGIETQDTLL